MMFSDRGLLPRASLVLLGTFVVVACSAEGSTSAEIDEADEGAGSATTTPDAGKTVASKDASVDARDSSTGDARPPGADAKADAAVDAGAPSDAAKDTGPKDAKVDSSTTGSDCPVDATYIAKAFAELLGSSPTMCLNNPCPASKCCVQIYGVCVTK